MAKPMNTREAEEKAKKKPGGQQHPNPPKKTDTNNPERNPARSEGTRRQQIGPEPDESQAGFLILGVAYVFHPRSQQVLFACAPRGCC